MNAKIKKREHFLTCDHLSCYIQQWRILCIINLLNAIILLTFFGNDSEKGKFALSGFGCWRCPWKIFCSSEPFNWVRQSERNTNEASDECRCSACFNLLISSIGFASIIRQDDVSIARGYKMSFRLSNAGYDYTWKQKTQAFSDVILGFLVLTLVYP